MRLKPKADLATRAEFEALIDETVALQLKAENRTVKRDKAMLALREEYDPEIKSLREQIDTNLLRCERFAVIHRDSLFARVKSAASSFATYGFRTGNPTLMLISRKWKWEQVMEAIKVKGWAERFIAIKETVDKDAIKAQLCEEELASIGTCINQSETFFVEPKRDAQESQRLTTAEAR